jgi:hypothetical protein
VHASDGYAACFLLLSPAVIPSFRASRRMRSRSQDEACRFSRDASSRSSCRSSGLHRNVKSFCPVVSSARIIAPRSFFSVLYDDYTTRGYYLQACNHRFSQLSNYPEIYQLTAFVSRHRKHAYTFVSTTGRDVVGMQSSRGVMLPENRVACVMWSERSVADNAALVRTWRGVGPIRDSRDIPVTV